MPLWRVDGSITSGQTSPRGRLIDWSSNSSRSIDSIVAAYGVVLVATPSMGRRLNFSSAVGLDAALSTPPGSRSRRPLSGVVGSNQRRQ